MRTPSSHPGADRFFAMPRHTRAPDSLNGCAQPPLPGRAQSALSACVQSAVSVNLIDTGMAEIRTGLVTLDGDVLLTTLDGDILLVILDGDILLWGGMSTTQVGGDLN